MEGNTAGEERGAGLAEGVSAWGRLDEGVKSGMSVQERGRRHPDGLHSLREGHHPGTGAATPPTTDANQMLSGQPRVRASVVAFPLAIRPCNPISPRVRGQGGCGIGLFYAGVGAGNWGGGVG